MSKPRKSQLIERIGQLPPDRQLCAICAGTELLIERRDSAIIALRKAPKDTSCLALMTLCSDKSWQALQLKDVLYLCAWRRLPVVDDDWLTALATEPLNADI
jgi:hypothetical protein